MNYAELTQAISDWLNKDSIDKILPVIVRFAQRDIEDNLRIRPMEYHPSTASLSAATEYLALPSDYLELIYLELQDGVKRYPIEYREDIKTMKSLAYNTDETGLPKMIARLGENLYFDVKTDMVYTRDWSYYRRLTVLSATAPNNTNWWSENAEEAFMMACLNKASLYVTGITKEDKEKWATQAATARESLRLTNSSESNSGVIQRSNPWIL
jgi:hypothetical protein